MHEEVAGFRAAWAQLRVQWEETAQVWHDEVRRSFEAGTWRELDEVAREVSAAAGRLTELLDRARDD